MLERIDTIVQQHADERALRVAVLAELRVAVPFDAFAWLLTDPVSCVGSSPVAEVPVLADLPRVISGEVPVDRQPLDEPAAGCGRNARRFARQRSLGTPTRGVRCSRRTGSATSRRWCCADAFGCWGFIDLWRRSGTFAPDECATLGAVPGLLIPAVRRALLRTFETPSLRDVDGPAVLLLTDDLAVVGRTDPSEHYLRALLPAEAGDVAIPAAAFNVAAQLLAVEFGVDERPAHARVHVPGCSWMTTSAARVTAPTAAEPTIAVSIEPTPPAERTALYGRVAGLTARETDVLETVVAGPDSRHAARHPGDLRAHLAGSPQVDLRQDRRRLTPVAHRPRHRCDEVIGGSAATTPAAPPDARTPSSWARTTERATSNRVAA